MKISATFDTPDSADFALMQLRRSGIDFKILSTRSTATSDLRKRPDPFLLPTYMPDDAGTQAMRTESNALGYMPIAIAVGDFDENVFTNRRRDIDSRPTRLEIDVDRAQAKKAEQMLISKNASGIVM